MTTNGGQYAPVFLPRETPPWQPQSTGSQRVRHDWSNPARIDTRIFLPVAALPQWQLSVKMAQLLSLWGPWRHQVCRDTFHHRSYGPIRIFFQVSCSWWSVGLFGQSFSVAPPIAGVLLCCSVHQAHRGVFLAGVLLCSSVHQIFDGPASVLFSSPC